jgi:DNA-binding NarL/FixJ family response regulator
MLTPNVTNGVIMDMSGIDAVIALRPQFPDARIIILTTFGCGAEIKAALAGGARFYMVKAMAPMEMQEISLKAQAAERAGTLAISS